MTERIDPNEEVGPLVGAREELDKWRSKEFERAEKTIGNLLSQTDIGSDSRPMLYDMWIKLRGLK